LTGAVSGSSQRVDFLHVQHNVGLELEVLYSLFSSAVVIVVVIVIVPIEISVSVCV